MTSIAILVPVTSRNQSYKSLGDVPFFKCLYPSFNLTKNEGYTYTFFIGYDDDDLFYKKHHTNFDSHFKVFELSGCQHGPARAWNKLAMLAYEDVNAKYDYFFQIGDDVTLETFGWTTHFIEKLKSHRNLGVVGPCNIENYTQRISSGNRAVIENAFVHRTHLDIFGYFFHPEIANWYCDNWITEIYKDTYSEIQTVFTCLNSIRDNRYIISNIGSSINSLIIESSKKLIPKRVFSYCVFGNQPKYCLGMVKNLDQIKKLFPNYETWITIGNDVPQSYIDIYSSYKNVKLTRYDINSIRITAYRLFPLDNPLVEILFTRDADSRFSERDIWCMNQFIKSDCKIYTVRDHSWQQSHIQMGQSGFRNLGDIDIQTGHCKFTRKHSNNIDYYSNDQVFATEYIYMKYLHSILVFSEYIQFPGENLRKIEIDRKNNFDFCGNVSLFNEDMTEYWEFDMNGRC